MAQGKIKADPELIREWATKLRSYDKPDRAELDSLCELLEVVADVVDGALLAADLLEAMAATAKRNEALHAYVGELVAHRSDGCWAWAFEHEGQYEWLEKLEELHKAAAEVATKFGTTQERKTKVIDFGENRGELWWLCTTCGACTKSDKPIGVLSGPDDDREAWAATKAHHHYFPTHAITFGFENGWSMRFSHEAAADVEMSAPELTEARR